MLNFLKFLSQLLCQSQDGDTICEVANNVWFQAEPRELLERCAVVKFEPEPVVEGSAMRGRIIANVRIVNAETDETIETQRWAITATRLDG